MRHDHPQLAPLAPPAERFASIAARRSRSVYATTKVDTLLARNAESAALASALTARRREVLPAVVGTR